MMKSSIPLTTVTDTCKQGKGEEQCRYLASEETELNWVCCKVTPERKRIIDEEVEGTLRRFREVNKGLHGLPLGDNCPGFGK